MNESINQLINELRNKNYFQLYGCSIVIVIFIFHCCISEATTIAAQQGQSNSAGAVTWW